MLLVKKSDIISLGLIKFKNEDDKMKKKALELVLGINLDKIGKIDKVEMDSRKIEKNDVFLAIRGGNNFVKEAISREVTLVICDDKSYEGMNRVIVVEDTVNFMQKWAKKYLELLKILVIGITGSNGKTSTKDIIYDFLSIYKKGIKTQGNYNNHIGLPFTVLNISENDEFAVLEMGMSGFGEIDLLADIAKPDYGFITNIGDSHLEFMKTRENIFKAKSEIIPHVKKEAIVNGDDVFLKQTKAVKIGFEYTNTYQIIEEKIENNHIKFGIKVEDKVYDLETNLMGRHNLYNLTMAFALIHRLGFDLNLAIEKAKDLALTKMRFEKIEKGKNIYINDAYNASPVSMNFALETFEGLYKDYKKIAVLGDMLELGEESQELHEAIYDKLINSDLSLILLYGNQMKYLYNKFNGNEKVYHFQAKQEIKEKIKSVSEPCAILLKGSRGMRLEETIEE